jgi:uncharacterized membrane protein YkvA (DUF1232 family)
MKPSEKLQNSVRRFSQQIDFYKRVYRHQKTPRVSKFFLGIALAYAASPIDLIPDFIPVIGYLDDLLIVPLFIWIALRLVPKGVIADCKETKYASNNGRQANPPDPRSSGL